MSKKWIKLFSLGASALLVFSLASCGETEDPADTSTPPESVSSSEAESATQEEPGASGESHSEAASPENGAPPSSPQSRQEWLDAFNQASGSLKCTAASQKLTAGKLWMNKDSDKSIDILAPDQTALLEKFQKSGSAGAALPRLSSANVASVQANGSTVTFTLTDTSATNDTVSQGIGGYFNVVDQPRTLELVEGVKAYANLPDANVKIDSADHSLSGGQFTVHFNEDFTQIASVQFTAKQHVSATMSYLSFIKIHADLSYELSSEYK